MKKMFTACIIASSIFAQNVALIELPDNGIRNIPFSFNDKQYIQTRIEGLDNIARNAIKINNKMTYFGTPRGIFILPNNATKVKKITGIDDNVVALTVDEDNNIYYVTDEHQAYIYYHKDGSIVQIKGLNDKLDDNPITGLALDRNNNLYLGTLAGLYCLSIELLPLAEEGPVASKINDDERFDQKIFALIIDYDNLYFVTDESKFFSVQLPFSSAKDPYKIEEYKLNQLIYSFAVDQNNNVYFGNYVYSSIGKTLQEVDLLDKTTLSIAVDQDNNVYYATLLPGIYFLKVGTQQVAKTNVFGTSADTIAIDQKNNIFINNNDGPFIFQVYEQPVVPPVINKKDTLVIEILGYVFLSSSGALGVSCLGTWIWNKYRYRKMGRD